MKVGATQRVKSGLSATVLLAAIAQVGAGQTVAPEAVVRKALPSVVQVTAYEPSQRSPSRLGSGFFISGDGLVATNLHVIAGAERATVTLASGETLDVLGYVAVQARTDVVVLRVDRAGTPGLPLGNSDSVPPGAALIAIGSPEGFQNSVSSGVSSGLRLIDGVAWLQHSAPTSPGSSGGPLLNSQGQVVGLTTLSQRTGQNLNFAAPVNALRSLLPGDTLRPLSTLPVREGVEAAFNRPDLGETPTGITGVYLFGGQIGVYALAFIVELPTGALTGALFAVHPSGFYDVVPLSSGRRPGKTRDFDFGVGCVTFSGWLRRDGILAGDVTFDCVDSPHSSQSFEATPYYKTRAGRGFAGAKLWLLRLGAGSDSLWAFLATVGHKGMPETTRGALHAWRTSPAVMRYAVVYPRGGASQATDSVRLSTLESLGGLSLREDKGAVVGDVVVGGAGATRYTVIGYREDLALCFQKNPLLNEDTLQVETRERAIGVAYDRIGAPSRRWPPDTMAARQLRDLSALIYRNRTHIDSVLTPQIEFLRRCPGPPT